MKHYNKYQHFALSIDNRIVDVTDVTDLDNSNEQYFCPSCHKEMIAKRGNIRQWHFAHKSDKCSYDKYLHSIAEIMIMNWFNQNQHITLTMDNYEKCIKYNNCAFLDDIYCKRKTRVQFDLKTYYSNCIQEHQHQNFIADLYCVNKTDPNSPIFIEIFVTHECSPEKKNSNIRIIELKIESEEDILNITKGNALEESEKVRMFNFKRNEVLLDNFDRPLQKFILYQNSKSYVDRHSYSCKTYSKFRKGIYEISMPYDDCMPYFIDCGGLYTIGKAKAFLDKYIDKDCQLCKWQAIDMFGNRLCKLYRKCGNPKFCDDNDASSCTMFREDMRRIKNVIYIFNDYMRTEPVDIWHLE